MPNHEAFPSCEAVYITGDRRQHSCSFYFERSPLIGITRDGQSAWVTFTQAFNLLAREALYRNLSQIKDPPLNDQDRLTLKIEGRDPNLGAVILSVPVGTWPDLRGERVDNPRSSAKISFGVDEARKRDRITKEAKIFPPVEREVAFLGRNVCIFLDRPDCGQSEAENQAASREVARITGAGLLRCLTAKGTRFSLWAGEKPLSKVFDTGDQSPIEAALASVDKKDLLPRPAQSGKDFLTWLYD